MQRGFIQIGLVLLILLVAATTGAGTYFLTKSKVSSVEPAMTSPVEPNSSGQNSGVEQTEMRAEPSKPEDSKTIVIRETIRDSSAISNIVTGTEAPNLTSNLEKDAFDKYWNTYLKAREELINGDKRNNESIKAASEGKVSIAKPYAQNAIDTCTSAYEINLNNTPPNLPFRIEMERLNSVVGSLSTTCKRYAQTALELVNQYQYGGYPAAEGLFDEANSLSSQFIKTWEKEWRQQELKVVEEHNNYF